MTAIRKNSIYGYDHVYQITKDRGICFYTTADCLVWFTLLCVLARKYGIRVLSVCIMLNHFHIQIKARNPTILSKFMRDLTALFTRMYNKKYGLKGSLVRGQFCNAGKGKDQKIKENYIYICNNPVVKHAVSAAEQYRWNFLAYMESPNPFSNPIIPGSCSETMEQVLAIVRLWKKAARPIDYPFFDGVYSRLADEEKRQVLDYIVSEYNMIDYATVKHKWGDYQSICKMLATVSGSEYDLTEEYVQEDYRHYYQMIRLAKKEGYDLTFRRFNDLSLNELQRLANLFLSDTGASQIEISKFLHTPF